MEQVVAVLTFQPGDTVVPVALTLYRDHGRLRIDLRGAADDAEALESWLLDALELTVAARLP